MNDSRPSRLVDGCLMATAAVPLAVVAVIWWGLSSCAPPSPPDVAKVAHSARTDAASKQATTLLSDTFDRLWRDQPWLTPNKSQAVLDQCRSTESGLVSVTWAPVTCTRSVKAAAAFDGDFASRNLNLHKALKSTGWFATGDDISQVITNYYRPMKGRPEGSPAHPYGPSDLPAATYSLPRTPQVEMNVRWLTRGAHDPTRPLASGDQTVIRENQQMDTQAITKALRTHRYVILLELRTTYFDAARSPSPTASSVSYCACRSGNLCTCPGG